MRQLQVTIFYIQYLNNIVMIFDPIIFCTLCLFHFTQEQKKVHRCICPPFFSLAGWLTLEMTQDTANLHVIF